MSLPILSSVPSWVLSGSSVDLDFAGSRYFQQGYGSNIGNLLTVSRASTGYVDDLSGNWTVIGNNLPRISNKGLLVEEARTNIVLWNRDLTNAVWTKSNTTAALDQIGIDGTANSASSLTATAGNGTVLQSITLGSSARFQSAFIKRITGSGVVNMTTDNGLTWTAITVTSAWTRVTIPTQTLANPTVGFQIITNGDKVAIDFIQNENGVFQTSPILDTTVSVTRAADVVTLTNMPVFGSAYTLFAQGTPNAPATYGTNQFIANIGNISDRIAILRAAATGAATPKIVAGGTDIAGAAFGAWAQNNSGKLANAYATSDQAASFNGAAVTTNGSALVPAAFASATLGSNSGSAAFWNGYISRIALWPTTRLPNANLIKITT